MQECLASLGTSSILTLWCLLVPGAFAFDYNDLYYIFIVCFLCKNSLILHVCYDFR